MLTATTVRHGAESHVVRPDRVYATGVWAATPGYQPTVDAQAVATQFTRIFPPNEQGLFGAGLGELTWFQRTKLKWRLKRAARRMGMGDPYGRGPSPQDGAIPVTGGYAPSFIRPGTFAARLQLEAGQGYPPGTAPSMTYATNISPEDATAPERFAQTLITDRNPGWVGQRAGAHATQEFLTNRLFGI